MAGDPLRDAFRAALATVCTEQSVTIPVIDTLNTDANPDASKAYLELEFPGGGEEQYTFGAPGADFFREEGQVTVRIVYPRAAGRDVAEAAAAKIRNGFRKRRFPCGDRSVRITSSAPMGQGFNEGGMWAESLALGYELYNVG